MVDVILLIGQSNAKGCGNPEESKVPNSRCFEYVRSISGDAIIPMGRTLQLSDGRGTIAPAFSNTWSELTNNEVCFIHYAIDGSRIKNWNHDKNLFLNEAIDKFNEGIKKISNKMSVNKKYAVWIQGESDAKYGSDPWYYEDKLKEIANELDKRCQIEMMFVSQIGYWNGADENLKRCELIAAMQEFCCERDEKLCLASKLALTFSKRGLTIDEVHYSQEGLNELGEDLANNIYYFYKNNIKPQIDDKVELSKAKEYLLEIEEIRRKY
ncbi:sialate O-acetylesterase [Clostridium sp. 1001271B_151109_B4]|uniref:sialate O-acetylesterase n=1 Tax=Clostridium sp. 1001271B_151109_B4 TaxID=2787148 RepID=UPI001A9B5702|nr:sialate O-acetylesterase [Clostridium sp. 1001271B_151109_B4]